MPSKPPVFRPMRLSPLIRKHHAREPSRQVTRALHTGLKAWREIREAKLARNPLCECCQRKGCRRCARSGVRPARDVDHRDGNNADHSDANLQSLCKPCHSHKTATENGGFGRPSCQQP